MDQQSCNLRAAPFGLTACITDASDGLLQGARTFFSEIISSISDLKFSRDGRFLLSRDYMTLKLWDVRKESGPVAVHNVHEGLRSRVSNTSPSQAWHCPSNSACSTAGLSLLPALVAHCIQAITFSGSCNLF